MDKLLIIGLMIVNGALGAVGAIQLKLASKALKFKFKKIHKTIFNKQLIFGLIFYGLAFASTVFLLSTEKLSLIYPLTSITYVFTIIFSKLFLKENITKYKWLAVTLIIIGNILITYQI